MEVLRERKRELDRWNWKGKKEINGERLRGRFASDVEKGWRERERERVV